MIKSFAGFHPQAVRRRDGVLIIGYGHSQTARSGVEITEAEAELLLYHDLIPVIEALHTHVTVPLSQPRFDALASFVLSIGVERFLRSDVLEHLNRHEFKQAAQAMSGWPDRVPPPVDAPYRRRFAEQALFESDPDQRADLGQILTAPIYGPPHRAETGVSQPHAATIPVLRHEPQKPVHEAADYGAMAFVAAIGLLALVAGVLAFKRDLPPSHPGDGALYVGAALLIAGAAFVAAAIWTLMRGRNKHLFI